MVDAYFWPRMFRSILFDVHFKSRRLTSVSAVSLCVFVCRNPKERQLGAPWPSEEGGVGCAGQTPKSCPLRSAAPAHQLTAHRVHSRQPGVTQRQMFVPELWKKCLLFLLSQEKR